MISYDRGMMDLENLTARVDISPWRAWGAIFAISALCVILLTRGLFGDATLPAQILSAACIMGSVLIIIAILRRRNSSLYLTQRGIEDPDGRIICAAENIASVDRGAFAVRPSNGFVVRLKEPQKFDWQPGLWWRYGTRMGIGGLTSGPQSRAMSGILALRLGQTRDASDLVALRSQFKSD